MTLGRIRGLALIAYGLLMAVIAAWELVFAPAHTVPPVFWFGLKELPLLAALPGLWAGRLHTFEWSGMLIILYFVDGVMNMTTKRHESWTLHAPLSYATIETVLAVLFFTLALIYLRLGKRASAEQDRLQRRPAQ